MNIEALASQACLLHDAFLNEESVADIDQRIQQIHNEYLKTDPEKAKAIIDLNQAIHKPALTMTQFHQFQKDFFEFLSKDIPDLDKRIQHHDHFLEAFKRHAEADHFEELERILKESPIDLTAFRLGLNDSLLTCAFEIGNIHLAKFLLNHGMKIEPDDMQSITNYLLPGDTHFDLFCGGRPDPTDFSPSRLNDELLEFLMKFGLDINYPDLLNHAAGRYDVKAMRYLVFNGANLSKDVLDGSGFGVRVIVDAIKVREKVLKLQSDQKEAASTASPAGRKIFLKQCNKMALFLDIWDIDRVVKGHDRHPFHLPMIVGKMQDLLPEITFEDRFYRKPPPEIERILNSHYESILKKYEPIIPDLSNQIKRHDEFIQACMSDNLEAAENILEEGPIHIDDCLARTKDGKNYYPLLLHAILSGNLKLLDFLIRAGADVNDYDRSAIELKSSYAWAPAIIEVAWRDIPNKTAIMERLKQAGGEINLKSRKYSFLELKLRNYFPVSKDFFDKLVQKKLEKNMLGQQALKKMPVDLVKMIEGYAHPDMVDMPDLTEDIEAYLENLYSYGLNNDTITELYNHQLFMYYLTSDEKYKKIYFNVAINLILHGARFDEEQLSKMTKGNAYSILKAIIEMRDKVVQKHAKKIIMKIIEGHKLPEELLKKISEGDILSFKELIAFKELPPEVLQEISNLCVEEYEKQKTDIFARFAEKMP